MTLSAALARLTVAPAGILGLAAGRLVKGAAAKNRPGRTELANLYLCGTDQGFLGIVGAMLSGISMANYHILAKS